MKSLSLTAVRAPTATPAAVSAEATMAHPNALSPNIAGETDIETLKTKAAIEKSMPESVVMLVT